MFAGVHRGFSPDRFSDAIDSSAEDQHLDAERSWNYELGTRMQPLNCLKTDVTLFYYDYQNKVTAASASSGVTSVNAGATVHKGVEFDLRVDWDKLWKLNYSFYSKIAYSFIDLEQNSGATEGKDLNYAPNQLLNFQAGVEAKNGWGAYVEAVFVDKMFDDLNNTVEVSADGSLGIIPSHTVWNLALNYTHPTKEWMAYLKVVNVFDNEYISSRNSQGIFAGPFRQIYLGVKTEF